MEKEALAFYENTGDRFYQAYVLDDLTWTHEIHMDIPKRFEMVTKVLQIKREAGVIWSGIQKRSLAI